MIKFKWAWCEYCERATPICPGCGNNLCNGGSLCAMCDEVYDEWDDLVCRDLAPESELEVDICNKTENL